MYRRIPALAVLIALVATAFTVAPAQATPPAITDLTVSAAIIYPQVNLGAYPGRSTITVTGPTSPGDRVEIRSIALDSVVNTIELTGSPVTWDGRSDGGDLVPAGSYKVAVANAVEASLITKQITVSPKKLIRKTFTKTVTAAGSMAYKYVGKCSTLKKPSKRKWKGSLGYYANTKCKKQTWNASRVNTQHVLRVPAADRYVDMRINTYGGASKKGSRARIGYFQVVGLNAVDETFISSKVGNHNGPLRRTMTNMVSSNHYISWGFVTAFKSQYDVKNFTVVMHYDVVG